MPLASTTSDAPDAMQSADTMRGAIAAYQRGRYAEALPLFESLAAAGDPEAQAWLGACYANGTGVAASLATAFAWYKQAAEQGHIQAATNVGAMAAMGQGTEPDRALGIAWLHKAADAGDAMARYNLATLYSKGEGPRDSEKAVNLYRLAAETGHYPSQARLGHCYANGIGIEKNRVEAFAWLTLAAQHGVGTALKALEGLIGQMSAEEKQKGAALAQRWRGRTMAGPGTINPLPA